MKKTSGKLVVAISILLVFAGGAGFGAPVVMRAADVHPDTHPFTISLRFFAERAAVLTNGAVKVEVYPAGQLGNERDLAEGVQIGTVDLAVVTTAVVSGFEPKFQIFSLPFLFENEEELYKKLDGPLGEKYTAIMKKQGMDLWGYWVVGGRGIYSKRPVRTPEDVRGMKIRTLESAVVVDTWKALGAIPAPLPWGDVYTALQTGVVDGAEGSMLGLVTAKHGEVVKNFTDLQYIISGNVVIVSETSLKRLDNRTKNALKQAMDEASQKVRELFKEQNVKTETQVRQNYGVTIIKPDLAPFKQKVKEIYGKYRDIDQADIQMILSR